MNLERPNDRNEPNENKRKIEEYFDTTKSELEKNKLISLRGMLTEYRQLVYKQIPEEVALFLSRILMIINNKLK